MASRMLATASSRTPSAKKTARRMTSPPKGIGPSDCLILRDGTGFRDLFAQARRFCGGTLECGDLRRFGLFYLFLFHRARGLRPAEQQDKKNPKRRRSP